MRMEITTTQTITHHDDDYDEQFDDDEDLRFYVLSTVFQSYQEDGRLIMKGCVQWSSVYG